MFEVYFWLWHALTNLLWQGYKNVMREEDTSFKVLDGRVQEIDVTNVYMRKSLKPGIIGIIENADWLKVLASLLVCVLLFSEDSRLLLVQYIGKHFDLDIDQLVDLTEIIDNSIFNSI